MKFRIKDLNKYLVGNKNWNKISAELNDKSFETTYNGKFIEVDILPNRFSDSASLVGIAREICSLTNLKLKEEKISIKESHKNINNYVELKIKTSKCLNYFGRIILNVKNSKSPKWLRDFLNSYEINSINLLVDLSNFVMIEYGTPIHIFDLDKLYKNSKEKVSIIVDEAKEKELFISLKGENYLLPKGAILIKDEKKNIALAGIQGSKVSEVDLNTKNIFIEAAVFDQNAIYKTSREINLQTDASYRFERKMLAVNQLKGLERVTYLIHKYCGGEILNGMVKYGTLEKSKNIVLRFKRLKDYTGVDFNRNEVMKILKKIGCNILKATKDYIYISTPNYRADLNIEEDIIEEIIRIHGLNKIKSKLPRLIKVGKENELLEFKDFIREFIRKAGINEVLNYSFIDDRDLEIFNELIDDEKKEIIEISNPISNYFKYYRPFIFINLIKSIKKNLDYYNWIRSKDIYLFEIGDVGMIKNRKIEEETNLGIALTKEDVKSLLLKIKGILNFIKENIGFDKFFYIPKDKIKNSFELIYDILLNNKKIGIVGIINKKILNIYDISQPLGIIELNLNKLYEEYKKEKFYQPIPKFPAILRDLSIVVREYINSDQIEKEIFDAVGNILEDIELFDIYMDIKEGYKGLSYHLIFRNPEKTLSSEEVNEIMDKIVKRLKSKFDIEIR